MREEKLLCLQADGRGARAAEMGRHLDGGHAFTKKLGLEGAWLVLADFIVVYICPKNNEGGKFPPGEKL